MAREELLNKTYSVSTAPLMSFENILKDCEEALKLPKIPMCEGFYMNTKTLESESWKEDVFLEAFLKAIQPLTIPVFVSDWIEDDQILIKGPNKELSALLDLYRVVMICKEGVWRGPISYRRNKWVMKKSLRWR